MLIEFAVSNFRSIKDTVELSMLATSDKSLPSNLITDDALGKDRLLRSAVLYGANASGKTNVLLALNWLASLVYHSHRNQKGDRLRYRPFKLDPDSRTKPTSYRIVFVMNSVKYVYGLTHTDERVISEYLYYYPRNYKSIIFERESTNEYRFTKDKGEQDFISDKTPENVLYLSRATQLNYSLVADAFEWFQKKLMAVGPTDRRSLKDLTFDLIDTDAGLKRQAIQMLNYADDGINDLSIRTIKIEDMDNGIMETLQKTIGSVPELERINELREISTYHNGIKFDLSEESEGTKRLFSLIGPWLQALRNGRVLVVDELDTKLHHLLNRFLAGMFHNETFNRSNAQLIFTTHNINLLDLDLFRRDQIWLTEKKDDRSTDLYSLVEFHPRKDKNIMNGYLAGRYGGIPYLRPKALF